MFWTGLQFAFGACSGSVILSLGYMLASCRALKKYLHSGPTPKSLIQVMQCGDWVWVFCKNLQVSLMHWLGSSLCLLGLGSCRV